MKYICNYCNKKTNQLCYCFFDEMIYDDDGKLI